MASSTYSPVWLFLTRKGHSNQQDSHVGGGKRRLDASEAISLIESLREKWREEDALLEAPPLAAAAWGGGLLSGSSTGWVMSARSGMIVIDERGEWRFEICALWKDQ